jgi:hypothetical protein
VAKNENEIGFLQKRMSIKACHRGKTWYSNLSPISQYLTNCAIGSQSFDKKSKRTVMQASKRGSFSFTTA